MARHDIECEACNCLLRDVTVRPEQIQDGQVLGFKCPDCENKTFRVSWAHGQAPGVSVSGGTSNEDIWNKSKTIGEYWDRKGLEFGGKANKEANAKRVRKLRNKSKGS